MFRCKLSRREVIVRLLLVAILATALVAMPLPAQNPAPPPLAEGLADADRLLRSGKSDDALRIYRAVLERDPASAAAQVGVARAQLHREDFVAARDAAAAAVSRFPNYPPAHTVLADVHFREGHFGPAEEEYRAATRLDSNFAPAWLGWARIAEVTSHFATAHRYLEHARRAAPDDPDVLYAWADLQRSRPERLAALRRYLEVGGADIGEEEDSVRHRIEYLAALGDRRIFVLASPPAPTEIQLVPLLEDPQHIRGWGLTVAINGARPEKLLLDTGAGGIAIGSKMAARLNLKRLTTATISGIGDQGPVSGYRALAERVVIGGLEFHDCLIDVSDKKSVGSETGLIGTDVFSRFLVTLDFPKRRMRLTPIPAEDSGLHDPVVTDANRSFTQFFRFGHMLLIPVRINDREPSLFVVDTGATLSNISDRLARQSTKVHRDPDWKVKGISGSVKNVYVADKIQLQFSHFRQSGYDMISFDFSNLSRDIGTEVSGTFGVPLLSLFTVVIDYRNGRLDFAYQPPPGSK